MKIGPAIASAVVVTACVLFASSAQAGTLSTVDWVNPNPAADQNAGTGSGTLLGMTVGYSTVPGGVGNAAVTLSEDWNTSLATSGAVGSGASVLTGGVLGTIPAPAVSPTPYCRPSHFLPQSSIRSFSSTSRTPTRPWTSAA